MTAKTPPDQPAKLPLSEFSALPPVMIMVMMKLLRCPPSPPPQGHSSPRSPLALPIYLPPHSTPPPLIAALMYVLLFGSSNHRGESTLLSDELPLSRQLPPRRQKETPQNPSTLVTVQYILTNLMSCCPPLFLFVFRWVKYQISGSLLRVCIITWRQTVLH